MPSIRRLEVLAPARLHFGLRCWGPEYERQFGGVGMMVRAPALRLELSDCDRFRPVGAAAERIRRAAKHCATTWSLNRLPNCRIEAVTLPQQHVGFGVGTQLALAVARGLAEWVQHPVALPTELAAAAGRGRRSAVGTYGFAHGGLIVDAGKRRDEPVGQLQHQCCVPWRWHVVLATPRNLTGIAGHNEAAAFAELRPVPRSVANRLHELAIEHIVPACESADFDRFASAVYEYGHLAGECFASVQGGPFASQQVAQTVDAFRMLGAVAVGQSSWGPTVFAFMPDLESAEFLAQRYLNSLTDEPPDILVTSANNIGASITASSNESATGFDTSQL